MRRARRGIESLAGTSGGSAGTGGAAEFRFPAAGWLCYAVTLLLVAAVGASSFWIEARRDGAAAPFWPFAVDEVTSVVVIFALTPPLVAWTARLDPRRIGWAGALLGHLVGLAAFSAVHIAGMTALRRLVYTLLDRQYLVDPLPVRLLYEGRKDALTYIGLVSLAWLLAIVLARRNRAAEPEAVGRLEIRDGARRIWVDPAEILWAEAAGNYVELHLRDRSLLRRQTLSALERELEGRGFVRIHRSRLVNRHHIRETTRNESGDLTVVLTDGRKIAGSRRVREQLGPL